MCQSDELSRQKIQLPKSATLIYIQYITGYANNITFFGATKSSDNKKINTGQRNKAAGFRLDISQKLISCRRTSGRSRISQAVSGFAKKVLEAQCRLKTNNKKRL